MASRKKVQPKAEGAWADAAAASESAQRSDERSDDPQGEAKGSVDIPAGFVDFCDRFRTGPWALEPGQRALARVLFDKVDPIDIQDEDERGRALRMFGCERIPPDSRRAGRLLALCGRRSGKSSLFAWRAVHLALTLPITLLPGQQAHVAFVGPGVDGVAEALMYAEGAARVVCNGRVSEDSSKGFTLTRYDGERVRFIVLAASAKGAATRGRAFICCLLDEAAMFRGDDAKVNDQDVIDSLTPAIMLGGEMMVATTPWTREGWVWKTYDANFSHPKNAVVAHAPTWEVRSSPDVMAKLAIDRETDERKYQRESGAVFLDQDVDAFFDAADLDRCTEAAE